MQKILSKFSHHSNFYKPNVKLAVLTLVIRKVIGMAKACDLYQTKPLPIGIEVFGVDLNQPINDATKQCIMKDVTMHRIVVFRNQGVVKGSKQVEISRWFGDIDNVSYYKHPASPSIDIFRVSNHQDEGATGVGMSGWHIDGTFRECPYAYSIYHMVKPAINGGDTMFIPLTEIVQKLSPKQRSAWDRLWMFSDRAASMCHPLIYPHPKTGRPALCFHQGMTSGFVKDFDLLQDDADGKQQPSFLDLEEERSIREEIQAAIDAATVYSHKWQESGDFIISDNLAVGHMAGPIPSTIEKAGLRILHRVTVKGTVPPSKRYGFDFPDKDKCSYG